MAADPSLLLRMAEQPGLGEEARSKMLGGEPRRAGVFAFDLGADPAEEEPHEIRSELLDSMIRAFIDSAGRMVPGLQIALSGRREPVSATIKIEGTIDVVQAWSTAPMTVNLTDGGLVLECENAFPMCVVATAIEPAPRAVSTAYGVFRLDEMTRPTSISGNPTLWLNPPRTLIVNGHEETMKRLRAPGYIE